MENITYKVEDFFQCLNEAFNLTKEHWLEIGFAADKYNLDINFNIYDNMYKNNMLHLTTARHNNKLIAYALFFVFHCPHVQSKLIAQSHAIYVQPLFRKGYLGLNLLKKSEQELIKLGVKKIMQISSTKKNYGNLLKRMGYELTEITYSKEI